MSADEFAVSAAAAGISHVLHHPLYMLKSQMMYYGPKFRFSAFVEQASQQPRFLYRGVVSRTIGIMPEKAFKMQAWIIVGRLMDKHIDKPTISKWIVAGAAAGAATTLIGCPSERAMTLAHIRKQAFMAVVRTTGLRGLYFGWTATIYRDISFNIFFFTVRELCVRGYVRYMQEDPNPWRRVVLGYPGGFIASVVACPFDVVKTRMQGNDLHGVYQPCSHIIRDIIRKEGPRHLMKGLLPRLIAVPSMMSVFYVINEELEKAILHKQLI